MFNNSFNSPRYCQKNHFSEVTERSNENKDGFSDEWDTKFDISIPIVKDEYSKVLSRIKSVDEKANKYLLVVSIVTTGMFVIASSSAIDSLKLQSKYFGFSHYLSIIFILSSLAGIWFGYKTFRALLECLNLVETNTMPDILLTLQNSDVDTSVEYKHHIISSYQEAINSMSETAKSKQNNLRIISLNIKYFVSALFLSFLIITILNILD